jgi:hypothetical protein
MFLYSEQHNEAVTRAVGHLRVKEGNYFAFNSNIHCGFADVSTEQPRKAPYGKTVGRCGRRRTAGCIGEDSVSLLGTGPLRYFVTLSLLLITAVFLLYLLF